ncbi:MAG TPA: cbb3-type cytochrome c oxidase subunit I [Gemmatimonadaceae bacterium]|nr:cbb3-type cytochrome c oxidase subunit I [Gemmatimonadaceae bacterium]
MSAPGQPRFGSVDAARGRLTVREVDAVASARGLAPEDLDVRLRADASSRRAVLALFTVAIGWLIVGTIFGDIASIKLHSPDFLTQQAWLTFGRVRTAHLHAVNYGWGTAALIGMSLWLMPRLVHTELKGVRMAIGGAVLFTIGIAVGIVAVLAGVNDGMEWLEAPRWLAGPFLVVGGGLIGLSLFWTVASRKAEHLYVSVWYILGAFIWFPMLYVVGKWPTYSGVESAAANWFFAHNVLGFWLTAMSVGGAYYFIPKVLGRPVYSYQLSVVGFWSLAMFYSLNGMHHLVGGPLPTWMITTSIVASVFMFIPVVATAINLHMTVVGRFGALRYSPTLRFVVIGALAYTAVSLQGSFTALREVNRVTHFTHWTVAHSHVGGYLFVSFIALGAMYYIVPRLVGHEWPSEKLIRWHFNLVLAGIAIYVVALSWAGVAQGLALLDPAIPFQESVRRTLPGLWGRSLGGLILTAGHIVFAYHFWMMLRMPERATRTRPPFHEARPVLYTAEAEAARR